MDTRLKISFSSLDCYATFLNLSPWGLPFISITMVLFPRLQESCFEIGAIPGASECLNEESVCNVTDSSEEGMRDGKQEWKHRNPACRVKVSPSFTIFRTSFHWQLFQIGLFGWPFLSNSFLPVCIHHFSVVVS